MEEVLTVMLDMMEECVSTMVIASGKRMLHVLFVTLGFLALAVVCCICRYPAFISIPEAGTACVILAVINSIDIVNKVSINKVKDLLENKLRKRWRV